MTTSQPDAASEGPSTVRQSWPSRLKLASWLTALGFGAYLGYGIAYSLGQSGVGLFGALFAGLILLTILVALAVVAIVAALLPDKRGRPASRAVIVAGLMLVAGVGLGWAITPVLGLAYRAPVFLEARGTMNLSLDGIEGYVAQSDALAVCRSEVDAEGVAVVQANDVGDVGTGVVAASVSILSSSGRPEVQASIVPAVKGEIGLPTWQGPADLVDRIDGDRDGRVAFIGAALLGDETGGPPEGWPAELSGTLSWSCDAWLHPDADAQP